jgi:hypothetical protein
MAVKRFMIAPLDDGLQTDVKPWLISDAAFATLNNAYLYYGTIRKRFGGVYMNTTVDPLFAQLYSRLGMQIGTTDGAGDFMGTIPGGGTYADVGQIFGVGTQLLGHDLLTVDDGTAGPQVMLSTFGSFSTFDVTTGNVDIGFSIANAPVYWYPALPVMGLPSYIQSGIDSEELFGFDTAFAYIFEDAGNGFRWEILGPLPPAAGSITFTGTNSDFIWATNYRGPLAQDFVLFVTNNVAADGMHYFDPSINQWVLFNPIYSNTAGDTIETCYVMASFKDRLILFFTQESQGGGPAIVFPNRIRFSSPGDPTAVNAFNTNTTPGGGFIDMPTTEPIISVRGLKDRLIVFCEESTWELVYTNNKADPFRIQRINDELGVESAFSTVLFDKAILGIGNVGIHACNGTNVERIDEKVRQIIFTINLKNNGIERVYGIRDYVNELVYWTYPDETGNPIFPTKVLVYNYRKGSWAINDDSITVFGSFQVPQDLTWGALLIQWQEANFSWNNSSQQQRFRAVIAGNQEGFTFVVSTDISRNAGVLSITNIDFTTPNTPELLIINHNLAAGSFIYIENAHGVNIGDMNGTIFMVITVIDQDNVSISRLDTAGQDYTGGGVVTTVSRISILTKQYNFFQQDGRNAYVSKVDFNVDRTENGQIQVDYYASTSSTSLVSDGIVTGALLGTGVLETTPYTIIPFEADQSQLWHPVYFQAEGEYVQFQLYYSDAQMFVPNIAFEDFELNAMTIYAEPTSTRLQ